MSGLGGFDRPHDQPYEPAEAAPVTATDFNPFAALGLHPATATSANLRPNFLQAMRHRHEGTIARFPATANFFPSQVEVQQAYDYLSAPNCLAIAASNWVKEHHAVFFPHEDLGSTEAFLATATRFSATTGAGPCTPNRPTSRAPGPSTGHATGPSTGRATGSSTGPTTGSSFHPSPGGFSSGPRKSRRTTATGAGSSPATGATADNPLTLSSISSDDETGPNLGNGSPTPAPITLRSRPSAPTATGGPPPGTVGRPAGRARARAGARAAARTANRSSGSSVRNASITNPITNDRIIVGEWAHATAATPNAVVAGFDIRGRLFYRITNEDLNGGTVPAPIATATSFQDVNFRLPYQGMSANQVRIAVDQHLRLPAFSRP